jgi:hypothetical protein
VAAAEKFGNSQVTAACKDLVSLAI